MKGTYNNKREKDYRIDEAHSDRFNRWIDAQAADLTAHKKQQTMLREQRMSQDQTTISEFVTACEAYKQRTS